MDGVKTHCARGHAFTPENTRVTARQRVCLICRRERDRERYEAERRALGKMTNRS